MTRFTLAATLAALFVAAGLAGTAVRASEGDRTHFKPTDITRYERMMVQ